jgi:hypothetical protein
MDNVSTVAAQDAGLMQQSKRLELAPLGLIDILVFCVLAATLMFVTRGYTFGYDDHIEQLPQIIRLLDPSFCKNDFSVNANAEVSPRMYYSIAMAAMARHFPLQWLFLGLAWACNVMLALVTFGAAKNLVGSSDLAAMIAVALELGTPGFTIGLPNLTVAESAGALIPAGIAGWMAFAALWAGLRGRPLICGALASVACIIHPLVGSEVGAIGLAVATIVALTEPSSKSSSSMLTRLLALAGGFGMLGLTYLVFWHGRDVPVMSTKDFINVVARIRCPHHYLPSTFSLFDDLSAAMILLSFYLSWRWWRREVPGADAPLRFLMPVVIILLSWVGGYIFVELIPTRLGMTAQTFRLAGVMTWLCFLVIARTAGRLLAAPGGASVADGAIMLAGTGGAQPMTLLIGHASTLLQRMKIGEGIRSRLIPVSVLLTGAILVYYGEKRQSVAMLALCGLALWYSLTTAFWRRNIVPSLFVLGLTVLWLAGGHEIFPILARHTFSLRQDGSMIDDMALQAKKLTPESAVLLTPFDFGRVRLLGHRAIVVDFKGWAYSDRGTQEWMRRASDCYGPFKTTGFALEDEGNANYRQIDQNRMLEVAKRYGASYAILYRETPCTLPVLAENKTYKMVKVPVPAPTADHPEAQPARNP